MTQSKAAPADDLVGQRVDGRYTLLGVLGQGGMGVVFDGVHDELGRQVAIKVLNTAWATDRVAVERFLREARMASSFSHGNIVDVSDLGRLPDGRPYLVMPKIIGTDLATLLYEVGPQPAKRVAELLRGVASALDLIHAKGYVHRDIKPENLMYVAREDGSETVMLLDFGIAALVMTNERRLTAQGQVFGTPHYMAPEASTGAVPDGRGDVYALAAVAFEMITGELPFATDNVMQLLSMKLVNDAPSMASVSGLPFPAALEAVVARGLARNPAARYPTASTFVAALAAATDDAPVSWRSGVLRSHQQSDAHPLGSWRDARLGRADTELPVRSTPIVSDAADALRRPSQRGSDAADAPRRPSQRGSDAADAPRRPSQRGSEDVDLLGRPARGASGADDVDLLGRPSQRARPGSGDAGQRGSADTQTPGRGAQGRLTDPFDPNSTFILGAGLREAERSSPVELPRSQTRWFALFGMTLLAAVAALAIWRWDGGQKRTGEPAAPAPPTGKGNAQSDVRAASDPNARVPVFDPSKKLSGVQTKPQPTAAAPVAQVPATPPVATRAPPVSAPEQSPAANPAATPPAQAAAPAAAPRTTAGASLAKPEPVKTVRPTAAIEDLPPPPPPEEPEPAQPVVSVTAEEPEANAEVESPGPDPSQVNQLTQTATAALLRGEVVHAVELFREATRLDPAHALAWRSLGLALERAGDSRAALDAYQHYVSLVPTGQQADMVRERMRALSQP